MTLLFMLLFTPNAAATDKRTTDTQRILSNLEGHLDSRSVNPKLLAPAIYSVAREWNVSQELLTRIIIVESRGLESAVNNKSQDFGIMQIHVTNGDVNKILCAMKWQCALNLAAEVLSQASRACVYNVGERGSRKYPRTCINYERKLASAF